TNLRNSDGPERGNPLAGAFIVREYAQRHVGSRFPGFFSVTEVFDSLDGSIAAVHNRAGDNHTFFKSGLVGRAVRFDADDEHTHLGSQSIPAHICWTDRLDLNSKARLCRFTPAAAALGRRAIGRAFLSDDFGAVADGNRKGLLPPVAHDFRLNR